MLVIVSSSPREASALAQLTGNRVRPICTCSSVRQFTADLRKAPPRVVITRTCLVDGYSDDVLAALSRSGCLPDTRVIVLAGADCTPRQEARQLNLGADCVIKDPLRPHVLLEYAAKFLRTSHRPPARPLSSEHFALAGADVLPNRLQLRRGRRSVHVTPKEVELARLLAESAGRIVTYHLLYGELFNRAFAGESANVRVLFGKLTGSYRKLGIELRAMVRVTPKSGYCYSPPPIAPGNAA